MSITFRQATQADAGACVDMVYSSAPEIHEYLFARKGVNAKDYLHAAFVQGGGFLGYRAHTVAVHEGTVVGAGSFFHAGQYRGLEKTSFASMFSFFSLWQLCQVIYYSIFIKTLVAKPRPSSMYIANLGVSPTFQNRGVGSALINHATELAKQRGLTEVSLDVDFNNPRAEALYTHLGFRAIQEKHFKANPRGYDISGGRLMVRGITDDVSK